MRMAECAVFASGRGSNFQRIAEAVQGSAHHICCLICNDERAPVLERAREFSIPAYYVSYRGRQREEAEEEILSILQKYSPQLIVLAGFMKLLTPDFLKAFPGKIINIHPSLLPRFPGTRGIEKSYASEDRELGITIHYVDSGLDTGPIILQKSFQRRGEEPLEEIEEMIHRLEHTYYPKVIMDILESIEEEE